MYRPRPSEWVPDEYEHPTITGLTGTFDLEWTQADPSVGETVTGYVATLTGGRVGGLLLTREQVMTAVGGLADLRAWEGVIGQEATEQ